MSAVIQRSAPQRDRRSGDICTVLETHGVPLSEFAVCGAQCCPNPTLVSVSALTPPRLQVHPRARWCLRGMSATMRQAAPIRCAARCAATYGDCPPRALIRRWGTLEISACTLSAACSPTRSSLTCHAPPPRRANRASAFVKVGDGVGRHGGHYLHRRPVLLQQPDA